MSTQQQPQQQSQQQQQQPQQQQQQPQPQQQQAYAYVQAAQASAQALQQQQYAHYRHPYTGVPYITTATTPGGTPAPGVYPQYAAMPIPIPRMPVFGVGPHSRSSPPPSGPNALPDVNCISPDVASKAMKRLLTSELRNAGFDSAEPWVMSRLELEVVAFVQRLYLRAHEYANLANRAGPIATDLQLACEDQDIFMKDLRKVSRASQKQAQSDVDFIKSIILDPPPPRSPSPELLASDDEGAPALVPATLMTLPHDLPKLPPKHTYLRTPVEPPKKAAIPSLDKKLKTAGLVQESLQHLLVATDDSLGQEEGELFGHIVNWEASTHPRKRWKLN